MFSEVSREKEVLYSIFERYIRRFFTIRKRSTLWLHCFLVTLLRGFAQLHIRSEATSEHVDRLFGLWMVSDRFTLFELGPIDESCSVALREVTARKELATAPELDDHAFATLRAGEFLWSIS